jgi:hypothetical protein
MDGAAYSFFLQVANEPFHLCLVADANAAAQIEILLKFGNGSSGTGPMTLDPVCKAIRKPVLVERRDH